MGSDHQLSKGKRCWRFFYRWYPLVGVLVGVSAAGGFWSLGNPSAVILAITSSVFASVSLFDMILVHKLCGKGDSYVHKYREPSYAQYVMRRFFAWILTIASVASMIYFIVISAQNQEPLTGQSHWMGVVWSFMCLKWAGFALGHFYMHHKYDQYQHLREEDMMD